MGSILKYSFGSFLFILFVRTEQLACDRRFSTLIHCFTAHVSVLFLKISTHH